MGNVLWFIYIGREGLGDRFENEFQIRYAELFILCILRLGSLLHISALYTSLSPYP